MAFLTTYQRAEIAQIIATEFDNAATIPSDTSEGSTVGALINAKALVAAAIYQVQVAYVNSIARLGTIGPNPTDSTQPNPDVDSFVNAFGVYREQATPSGGQVVFGTASSPQNPLQIPAVPAGSIGGVIVQAPGNIQFQVIIDTANAAYNATLQAYTIQPGQTSVSVTVQCTTAGTIGNVAAGQIGQLYSGPGATPLAGIATITNPVAFSSASPLESDQALKNRFATQMSTGVVATQNAVAASILGVQLAITYSVGDQLNSAGQPQPGYFSVVVNNAGVPTQPSSTLLNAVWAAVNAVRPLGISFQVIAPSLLPVNLVVNVKVAPGYSQTAVVTACQAAMTALFNGIGLDPMGGSTLAEVAAVYATLKGIPGVLNVTNLQLNNTPTDVIAGFGVQIICGTLSVSPYS